MSPLTPAISSLKRIWMGWVISNAPPGRLSSVFSTFATKSDLLSPESGHSSRGLLMMKVSEMLGGRGWAARERKGVGWGKRQTVRCRLDGGRSIKKKKKTE